MNNEEKRTSPKAQTLIGALALTAAVVTSTATAAPNMFLKLGDIKGESIDDKHKAEIDVLAWSWGLSGQSVDAKGKVNASCSDLLSVDKNMDLSTTALATAAALNTTIPTGKLTVRKPVEGGPEYLVINFTGITVKSMKNGVVSGDPTVSENVKLGFAAATISYKPQKDDGSLGSEVTATVPASCP